MIFVKADFHTDSPVTVRPSTLILLILPDSFLADRSKYCFADPWSNLSIRPRSALFLLVFEFLRNGAFS
jgi:hypothetical protein